MTPLPPLQSPPTPAMSVIAGSLFLQRIQLATYGLFLFLASVYLLEKFRDILQPLFVAMFLGFLTHPIHRVLVRRGIPSMFAYGVILAIVALAVLAVGSMVYANFSMVSLNLPEYEKRLEEMVRGGARKLPFSVPGVEGHFLRETHIDPEQVLAATRAALGRFGDFTAWVALTFVYLLFLIAEEVSFPQRVILALGVEQGRRIMGVVESINQAIGEYIAVKTFVSVLAGVLSYAVLASLEIDFAATWGILIFLFNYIPYLGSLVAVAFPIVLSFVQFDEVWRGIAVTISLIVIQQVIGTVVEPRLAGRRLDVSPLLILLSLAFWGTIWGIPGMLLAVPLLVIVKIVLDNIQETKPLATLISNQ